MSSIDIKQSEEVIKSINKWKSKSTGHLHLINHINNTLYFTIISQKFSISIPSDYPQCETGVLFVDIPSFKPEFEWLQHINTYISDRNPSIYKLLCYIEKQAVKNIKNNEVNSYETIMEDDEYLSKFDIDEIILKKRLEDELYNMKSTLSVVADSSKAPVLFTGNIPGNILIKEYLSCRQNYRSNNKISIDLIDNNVYQWKIQFKNFNNTILSDSIKELYNKFGYDNIELHIHFHDKLYPTYPPFIKVIRPRLNNSLMNRITSLKMIQLEYWSPSRNMLFVIDKLYEICNKHLSIDVDNTMNNISLYPNGAYHPLESIIVKLTSFCDYKDEYEQLDTTEYKKVYSFDKSASTKSSNTYWKKGTGYGHSGSSNWSINEYMQLQKEKDVQIQSILQAVITSIQTSATDQIPTITKILTSSYIIPFLKSYLNGTTIMEISKHKDIFHMIFTLLQNFANEEGIILFADNSGKSLYDMLIDINKEALQVMKFSKSTNTDNDETDLDIIQMIIILCEMITPCYNSYMEKKEKFNEDKKKREDKFKNIETKSEDTHVLKYKDTMELLKFDMAKLGNFSYTTTSHTGSVVMRRLAREFGTLSKSLPIFYQSSIFVKVDEENSKCIRALITGPDDTPYDSGVYIFDIYINDNYPAGPPSMIFLNHGGKRFNPNLYNCGKVCLSLLGTWRGSEGENWNKETSTLNQLLISVQSQILIDNPYFNEPGWESSYGSSKGLENSKSYNNYIRYYNMCHAMYDILANSNAYPEFRDIIKTHFTLKKDYIIQLLKKWTNEAFELPRHSQHSEPINKQMYETKFAQLVELLNKL